MKRIRLLSALVMTGIVAASVVVTAVPSSAQVGDPTVWFVQGVPGATVEVCVNGVPTKDGFGYRQTFSMSQMPIGDYTFALYADGANCTGTPLDDASLTHTVGTGNYTIVAGVDAQTGRVRFFWFRNYMAQLRTELTRVVIRPIGVAPAVNVFIDKVRVTNPALAQEDLRRSSCQRATASRASSPPERRCSVP